MEARDKFSVIASVKKRLILIVGLMALAILAIGVYGLFGIAESNRKIRQTVDDGRRLVEAVDAARSSQVHFKKQVQEWKNILIRGNDAALFENYLKAFQKEGSMVQKDLEHLKILMKELGLTITRVDKLLKEHERLDLEYITVIKKFDSELQDSGIKIDKMVRGIDREMTDRMDDLVASIREVCKSRLSESAKGAEDKLQRDRSISNIIALLALAGIILGVWLSVSIIQDIGKGI